MKDDEDILKAKYDRLGGRNGGRGGMRHEKPKGMTEEEKQEWLENHKKKSEEEDA